MTTNVKSFVSKGAKEEEISTEDFIQLGLAAFQAELDGNTKAFLAIIFDNDGNSNIICSGKIDLVQTVGALELAKNDLMQNSYPND